MDDAVNPIGNRPVLLKRGSNYTRIVVDRVTGLDQQTYDVMFLGTGKCFYFRKRYYTFLCILFQSLQKSKSVHQLCLKFCMLDFKRLSLGTFHIKGDLT